MPTLRSTVRPALVAALILIIAARAAAAEPQQPALADILEAGSTIWLTTTIRPEEEVHVVSIDDEIVVVAPDGARQQIALDDVVRVRERHSDALVNGIVIGAGAAVGAGLALCRTTEPWRNCLNSTWPIIRIGLAGAGIGAGVDALIRPRRTIFEAPADARVSVAPIIGPGMGGVVVRVGLR